MKLATLLLTATQSTSAIAAPPNFWVLVDYANMIASECHDGMEAGEPAEVCTEYSTTVGQIAVMIPSLEVEKLTVDQTIKMDILMRDVDKAQRLNEARKRVLNGLLGK